MVPDLPEPLDVIAVGAHPDDVEIGCGGTLASLVKQGYRVGIVDLTDGEPTPLSPGPDVRLAEAKKAAEILGVAVRETLGFSNRRLFDHFEVRVELAKIFRRYRPKLVLGIADKTPLASPDHLQTVQITDAAVFYSRLTKWDEQFDHLPVHRVTNQMWYPLGLTKLPERSSDRLIVDISSTIDLKLQSVKAYETQFGQREDRIVRLVESQSVTIGAAAGFDAGEVFYTLNPVGVTDPVSVLCETEK
ncbi:MAG: PIG-L family deacetylase [Planctomycetaceae bacterium]